MFQHSEFTWWQMQPTFSHSSGILWRHPNTATTEFWLLRWYVEMMTYKMFKWQLALSTTAVVLLKTEFVHLQVLRIVLKLLHQNNISSRKELITEFKGVKIHAKLMRVFLLCLGLFLPCIPLLLLQHSCLVSQIWWDHSQTGLAIGKILQQIIKDWRRTELFKALFMC